MLTTKEEYAAFVAKKFKLFNLNLELCDPSNIKLNPDQLFQLLEEVQNRIPEYLFQLPFIDISVQSAIEDAITVYVYSPFSSNPIVGFQSKFYSNYMHLECVMERSLFDIRKESLTADIQEEEIQPCESDTSVILIADDDVIVRRILKRWLINLFPQFIIVEKQNGREALAHIKSRQRCDLIFMDIQMPVMRGDIACLLIRQFEHTEQIANVPIIAVTATRFIKEHLMRSGFNVAMKKPLQLTSMHDAVKLINPIAPFLSVPAIKEEVNLHSASNANLQFFNQDESVCVISLTFDKDNEYVMRYNQGSPIAEQQSRDKATLEHTSDDVMECTGSVEDNLDVDSEEDLESTVKCI